VPLSPLARKAGIRGPHSCGSRGDGGHGPPDQARGDGVGRKPQDHRQGLRPWRCHPGAPNKANLQVCVRRARIGTAAPRNPGRRQSRGAAQRWYRPEVAGPSSRPSALALPPVDAKRTQFGPAVDRPRRGGRTREIRKIADGLRMSLNVINKANFSVFSAETEGADEKQSQFGAGVARPGRSMPENPKPEARYPKGRWWPENEAQRDKRTQFCRFQWGWWARPTLPGQP